MGKETTIYIWDNGDDSVGIAGDYATLTTDISWMEDGEDIEFMRETLRKAFADIWDNGKVYVAIGDEIDNMFQEE